jgi:hypothetical protein
MANWTTSNIIVGAKKAIHEVTKKRSKKQLSKIKTNIIIKTFKTINYDKIKHFIQIILSKRRIE